MSINKSQFHDYLLKLVGPIIWQQILKESNFEGNSVNYLIKHIIEDFVQSSNQTREESIEPDSKITVTTIDGDFYQFEDLKAAEEYIKDYGGKIGNFIQGAIT